MEKEINRIADTRLAERIIGNLLRNGIEISRVAITFEDATCLVFQKDINNTRMYLEIYEDGDIGYITENFKKKISLECEDITEDQVVPHVKRFLEKE